MGTPQGRVAYGPVEAAADSRNANEYFVYSCSGGTVTQIPASTMKVMKMDQTIQNMGWPTIGMPCYGVGVDSDQNVWGISMGMSTRALVDAKGNITQPKVNTPPMGNNKCPAGDQCPNVSAYTYSDFTGFGLRNFTRPTGSYTAIVKGCQDKDGNAIDTQWFAVNWDADVPPNTSLLVHAKASGASKIGDAAWNNAQWTPDAPVSPLLLQDVLQPNVSPMNPGEVVNDPYLLVEFVFKTQAQNASPKLKNFNVAFKCNQPPG